MNVLLLVSAIASVVSALGLLVSFKQLSIIRHYSSKVDSSLQQAINDVASDIATTITTSFTEPNVKRAMSILGKESGRARASEATISQFKDSLANIDPMISIASEKLGLEPIQLLEIWNDPTYGPMVQGVIAKFAGPLIANMQKPGSQISNIASNSILNNPIGQVS